MIEVISGDLFSSDCDAYVNTVNCKSVMGKGIALVFKQRYPEMFKDYKIADEEIDSVAIPALGCSNGGLKWDKVLPLMLDALTPLENVRIEIYGPKN